MCSLHAGVVGRNEELPIGSSRYRRGFHKCISTQMQEQNSSMNHSEYMYLLDQAASASEGRLRHMSVEIDQNEVPKR
jgi:hypothetical protein